MFGSANSESDQACLPNCLILGAGCFRISVRKGVFIAGSYRVNLSNHFSSFILNKGKCYTSVINYY